jgi:sec-independent protein translocase protein TatA
MGVSTTQILIILAVILLLFGGKKIPELASGLGKGIKNFKDAVKEEEKDVAEKVEKVEEKEKTQNA